MMETGDWHTTVMSSKLDWWGGGVLTVESGRWLIGCNVTGAN